MDICDKFITPALQQARRDLHEQIFREYTLRQGRVVVRGSTSSRDLKSVLRPRRILAPTLRRPSQRRSASQAVQAPLAKALVTSAAA